MGWAQRARVRGHIRLGVLAAATAAALLPQQAGAAGWTSLPPAVSVVGLGDSVMSGGGCNCQPFVTTYAQQTARATDRQVRPRNLGVSGWTAQHLADVVRSSSYFRSAVAAANIDLITIGANDMTGAFVAALHESCDSACVERSSRQVGVNVAIILDQIRAVRHGAATQILVTTYWDDFADGAVARNTYGQHYIDLADSVTKLTNHYICAAAVARGATCVDTYGPFKGGGKDPTPLLASDGDHPNATGHRVIANALLQAGYGPYQR